MASKHFHMSLIQLILARRLTKWRHFTFVKGLGTHHLRLYTYLKPHIKSDADLEEIDGIIILTKRIISLASAGIRRWFQKPGVFNQLAKEFHKLARLQGALSLFILLVLKPRLMVWFSDPYSFDTSYPQHKMAWLKLIQVFTAQYISLTIFIIHKSR